MKLLFLVITMVICFTIELSAQSAWLANSPNSEINQPNSEQLSNGSRVDVIIESNSLKNNFLGDSPNREVSIYLPPDYNDSQENYYPVLYLLHGYTGDNKLWYNSGYLDVNLQEIMDDLINQQAIIPMIVVSPNSYNTYRGSWYTNSSITGNWEDFIVKDVVQYVDDNYRTIPSAASRGIAGHSMGGYGAIKLAMKYPGVFRSVYSMSGTINFEYRVTVPFFQAATIQASSAVSFEGLDWTQQGSISMSAAFSPDSTELPFYCQFPLNTEAVIIDSIWDKWLLHDVTKMISYYRDSLNLLTAIQLDCGISDETPYNENVLFSAALSEQDIEHVFLEYQGNHTNKIAERLETEILPFFSKYLVSPFTIISGQMIDPSFSVQTFPNPTTGTFSVYTGTKGSYAIKINSMNGQDILEDSFTGNSYQSDLSSYQRGIYIVTIRSGNFITTRKMILQ